MILIRLLLIFIFFCSYAFAKLQVSELSIDCGQEKGTCKFYKSRMQSLQTTYQAQEQLLEALKSYSHLEGIRDFQFKLFLKENDNYYLEIKFGLKKLISNISFTSDKDEVEPFDVGFEEGDFVDMETLNSTKFIILKKLIDRGFPKAQVNFDLKKIDGNQYKLIYNIKKNKPIIVKDIKILVNNKRNLFKVSSSLDVLKYSPYNKNLLSSKIEELKNSLVDDGYLTADFKVKEHYKEGNVYLEIGLEADTLFVFEFSDNDIMVPHELKKLAKNLFLQTKGMPLEQDWINFFERSFKKYGYLDVVVKYKLETSTNQYFETLMVSKFEIKLNNKYSLETPAFVGNVAVKNKKIKSLFYDTENELIAAGNYDLDYAKEFSKILAKYYYSLGFVNVQISQPIINIDKKKNRVFLSYRINEGEIAYVDSINIKGVDLAIRKKLFSIMKLSLKRPFNPFDLSIDLNQIVEYLKNQGYYFARVTNLRDKDIVTYLNDQTTVRINIDIDLGDEIRFDRFYVIGNNKTKNIVFKRQLMLEPGELITPVKVVSIQNRLLATGLFESVRIEPIKTSQILKTYDLVVKVIEKKYGSIELAPGFRTDIGLKISTTITRGNLDGLNKSISLNAQVNSRVDGLALAPERRDSAKILEYNLKLSYLENDLFKSTYIDSETGLSTTKRRYYSFDANIQRVSQKLSRNFGEHLTLSFGYQLENIEQYNGIQQNDNGKFRIGTITPSIRVDYRNATINPREGFISDLSFELGNPFLLSQNDEDLEINYYKVVSRNAFYLSFGPRWTLANSLTYGFQENLAKNGDGYIPNIKVFRLAGIDTVRGYEDEEINRLISGEDISERTVDTTAYLVNYKFEPRYRFSDNLVTGVFFDAGRVFVDDLNTDQLRSSAGITFKYVTPVGTLDFDYGIKLLRKTLANGKKESPGRFHLSIGFF